MYYIHLGHNTTVKLKLIKINVDKVSNEAEAFRLSVSLLSDFDDRT